ncbi:23219_t:CDS:2, partial [Racocetra persica]
MAYLGLMKFKRAVNCLNELVLETLHCNPPEELDETSSKSANKNKKIFLLDEDNKVDNPIKDDDTKKEERRNFIEFLLRAGL